MGIITKKNLPNYDNKIEFLRSKLSKLYKKDSCVLDAGCGDNNPLLSKEEVRYLIGCDIDLCAVQDNKTVSCSLIADLHLLPFTGKFDLIVSIDVLEHVEEPSSFLREANRALKKEGFLFLVIPNRNSLFGLGAAIIPLKIKRILFKLLTGKPLKNEVHFYRLNTVSRLKRHLNSNGFDLVEITMMNYLSSQTWMRSLFYPYYFFCKLAIFARLSPNILCVARKR